MGQWTELANRLKVRDDDAINQVNYSSMPSSIEARLFLSEGRAIDALSAICCMLKHMDELDREIAELKNRT